MFFFSFHSECSDNEPIVTHMKSHFNTNLYFQTKQVQKKCFADKRKG